MAKKPMRKVNLVVSDKKNPIGSVRPGSRLEVVAVTLSGTKLPANKPASVVARVLALRMFRANPV